MNVAAREIAGIEAGVVRLVAELRLIEQERELKTKTPAAAEAGRAERPEEDAIF